MPQWDVADRLGKALRVSGISVHDMADYLGVHRNTVSAWLNGRVQPGRQTIRLWALRTAVPYVWLADGAIPGPDPGPDGGVLTGSVSTAGKSSCFSKQAGRLIALPVGAAA